jgi:hypothetical protein
VDEAVAVADRPTLEETERQHLLTVLDELGDETGAGHSAERGAEAPVAGSPPILRLSEEDEQLLARLRIGLALLAGSLRGERALAPADVQRTLDGAEAVARRDILCGRGGRLPRLLPSFVYLVALPLVGQSEALRVSKRAALLLEGGAETH